MTADLQACPGLPAGDDNAPVFAEPWMAQAFAMVLQLHQKGLFTWPEWAAALSAQIAAAQAWSRPRGPRRTANWPAVPAPGTTPPTARHMASPSCCNRRTGPPHERHD